MAEEFRHVKGMSQLVKFFEQLPGKIQRNVARGTLRAGAVVLSGIAKAKAPVGPASSENVRIYGGHPGALRDSIHVSTRMVNGAPVAKVVAGGGKKGAGAAAYYAHMVEYGTKPHTITAASRKALSLGGLFFQSVKHPGARAQSFMRPAMDEGAVAATVAAATYMKNRLATKEGLDVPDVQIAGDES